MTDIRCSSGRERPLGWNDPDLPPPVKRGNQREYVLAVYRESSKKIYSFACSYLNALPLQYEDACPKGAGCEGRGCDDGCPTTGWFWLTGEGDEAGTYQSLDMKPGDRIMGWRDLPQWGDAAQASGMPWEHADAANVDCNAFYLVKDNGGEWRDFDLHIMRGTMVNHKLAPNYIRGRPEWIAKISAPSSVPSTQSHAVAPDQYEFPYQQTFEAIAAATEIYPSKEQALGLSISVKKFQEAFNGHRDRRPLKGVALTSTDLGSGK